MVRPENVFGYLHTYLIKFSDVWITNASNKLSEIIKNPGNQLYEPHMAEFIPPSLVFTAVYNFTQYYFYDLLNKIEITFTAAGRKAY